MRTFNKKFRARLMPSAARSSVFSGLLFLSLTAVVSVSAVNTAQSAEMHSAEDQVVNILQEPRHRIVHHDGDIWVLDIQINPGDTTKQHTHNAAIMYTFISSGEGPSGGRVTSNTDYVTENYTHRATNEGPGLFRIIAITNYGAPAAELTADRPSGLSGDPELENPWFRSYRMTLAPGQTSPVQRHQNPSIVVQVSEGKTQVSREDGITAEFTAMGGWTWRDANSGYQITNKGSAPVELVINEARRAM